MNLRKMIMSERIQGILFGIFIGLGSLAFAQQMSIKTTNIDDGREDQEVYRILVDQHGREYQWIYFEEIEVGCIEREKVMTCWSMD